MHVNALWPYADKVHNIKSGYWMLCLNVYENSEPKAYQTNNYDIQKKNPPKKKDRKKILFKKQNMFVVLFPSGLWCKSTKTFQGFDPRKSLGGLEGGADWYTGLVSWYQHQHQVRVQEGSPVLRNVFEGFCKVFLHVLFMFFLCFVVVM